MSKYTKILFTFLIAIVSAHSAELLHSDKNSLSVKFKPEFQGFREITLADGNTYSMPKIKDAFIKEGAIGEPAEYILKEIITVPFKGAYNLSNVTPVGIRKFDKLIIPNANKYIEDLQQSMQANLSLYTAYNPDSKNTWAAVRDLGIARNKFIAEINVTVAYFNKNTQQIEIPEEIIVNIDFKDNNFFYDEPIAYGIDKSNSITTLNNVPEWNNRGINSSQLEYSFNIVEKDLANKSANNFNYAKIDKSNSIQADTYDNNWAKIEIPSEGVYKITAADLSKYGFSLKKEDIPSIKIYGNNGKDMDDSPAMASKNFLNDVPVIVNTNTDGSLESIIFYATGPNGFEYATGPFDGYIKSYRHFINHYSKNNYYMLAWGGSKPGKRLVEVETPAGEIVNKPTQYIHRVFQEEEFVNPYTSGSGRQFLGRSYFSNLIKQNLDGLANNDTVTYRFAVTHRSKTATGNFNFFDNERKIGGTISAGTTGDYGAGERGEIFAKAPTAGSQESSIRIDYKSSNTSATGFLDFIEWHWKRPFSAINGAISFFADTTLNGLTEYNMTGFGANRFAFDVSNPTSPILLKNISSNSSEVKFVVNSVAKAQQQFFVSSDIKSPTLYKADFAALRTAGEGFDVLLVTDKDLVPSAEKYKTYRESNSELKVKIVTTDQIYTEFSSGVPQVGAIRDYVAYTLLNPSLDNKTPSYLVLWGDGHFDFRNIQSGIKNMVPPFESLDDRTRFDEISSSCIDDFFARVIGNDNVVDIALGRVTINSNVEGERIIEKLRNYETGASKDQWRTRVTLVADDGLKTNSSYNEGDLHTGHAEDLSENHIAKGFIQKKIYLPQYVTEVLTAGRKKPTVNLDLVSTVNNQGTSVLYWIGHGNPTVWAHEGIFTNGGTIPEMVNKDKLFILSAATCDFARFDIGESSSGAEDLYLSKFGGAICVFAATRVVYAGENSMINNAFTSLMFKQDSVTGLYARFGDVMKQLKATFNGTNDEKYFFIGDPTMRPNFPNLAVKIDTINGKSTSDGTIFLKGLDKVTLTGRITGDNNSIISDFNGSVTLALYDGVNRIKVFDEDGKKYEFNKLGGALTNSSFEVKNGIFKAEFYIPKDISYSDTNATIYSFAASNDNRFGKGITSSLKVDGVNSVQSTDSKPTIKLYMESRDFKECGIVRQNPLLIADVRDEYGINSTGIGIGHKLEAWIDDNPQSIDLTDYYYPSLADSKSGTIIRALPSLSAGEHRARVRVWNVFNKFNMAEICFIVKPDTSGIEISNITNYPNPAETSTIIKFNHNLEPPFNVELNILNSVGGVVKTINKDITTSFSVEIPWDCSDNSNNKITSGVYPYSIVLKSKSGKTATGYGISTVIK